LEAHRERFQRAFRPRDGEESRLVRGMAEAAWRVLRSAGVRARWEMRAVQFRLMLIIAQRQAKERSGKKLEAAEANSLALKLLVDLGEIDQLYEERRQLLKRLEQLLRAFLSHRMGAASALRFFTSEGSSLPDFEHLPDFALSNPSLWPGLAEKLAKQEAAGAKKLKEPKEWKGQPKEGEEKPLFVPVGLSDEEKVLRHQLLQATGFKDELDQAGLERLLALALGIDDGGLPIADGLAEERRNAKSETREPEVREPQAANPESAAGSGEQASITGLAAALWERLVLFRNWRESEARELEETLEQASGPQGVETWEPQPPAGPTPKSRRWPELEDESPHWQWRALAALLLAVFAREMVTLTQAAVLAEGLQRALFHFMVGHYRQPERFEALRPKLSDKPSVYYMPEEAGVILLRARWANGVRLGTGYRV
jgi:hypothetical protein